jgi:hypothetical protein
VVDGVFSLRDARAPAKLCDKRADRPEKQPSHNKHNRSQSIPINKNTIHQQLLLIDNVGIMREQLFSIKLRRQNSTQRDDARQQKHKTNASHRKNTPSNIKTDENK